MIINTKRTTPRHMEIKMAKTKDKERLLKATRKGEATNNEVENPQKKKKNKVIVQVSFCWLPLQSGQYNGGECFK